MNKTMLGMIGIFAALAFAGCRTVDTRASGYQTTTEAGVSVTAPAATVATQQPVQVKAVGARPDAVDLRPAQTQTATASAVLEHVRVLVRRSAQGADAEQVAVLLGNGVQGAMAAAGYRVVYDGKAEIFADLGVTCEPLNARGTRVPVAVAFDELYYLERACRQQVLAMSTGRPLALIPEPLLSDTARQYMQVLEPQAEQHFRALKRVHGL